MKLSDEFLADMHKTWVEAFAVRFGGLDFWRLSKKWKQIRYKQFADIIIMDLKMINEEFDAITPYDDYSI